MPSKSKKPKTPKAKAKEIDLKSQPEVNAPEKKENPCKEKDTIIHKLEDAIEDEKKLDKKLTTIIIALIIFFTGVAIGFGIHYYDVIGRLKDVTAELTGTKEDLDETEDKLALEQEKLEEQIILLSSANAEIEELKKDAAAKAAEEAKRELEAKIQAEKDAKKFVITNKKESNLQGLNVRETPCGDKVSRYQVWGSAGEVLEGPEKPGECLGGDFEWYKVRWDDGIVGWSIVDYLDFSASRKLNNTGVLTGFSPFGYNYETTARINPTICATNQGDGITYCGADLDSGNFTYKLEVPAGDYIITGTYRYQDYYSRQIQTRSMRHTLLEACGYTQECFERYGDNQSAAIVKVEPSSVKTGINLTTVRD